MASVADHASPTCWRYGSEPMRNIFLEGGKVQYNLDVEAELARAEADLGFFDISYADEIRSKASTDYVTPEEVWKREQTIRHDIMSMVEILAAACKGEAGKYVHLGATSYDIEDNRIALQTKAATLIIIERLKTYGRALLKKADQYKDLPAIGRTHGQWAEPITFGHKFARYAYDVAIALNVWQHYLNDILVGKPMTGAVGTADSYVHLAEGDGEKADKIGERVMKALQLNPALITDQSVPRLVHALAGSYMQASAAAATRFAWEVWNLQRPEIGEMWSREYKLGQVSSTAMPHKRNPIDPETVIALGRVMNRLAGTGYDNVPLLHETELTKSGSERIWLPTGFILLDEQLLRAGAVAEKSTVREGNVTRNLARAAKMTVCEPLLMNLVGKGVARNDAHKALAEYAHYLYEEPDAEAWKVMQRVPLLKQHLTEAGVQHEMEEHANYTGNSSRYVRRVVDTLSPLFS